MNVLMINGSPNAKGMHLYGAYGDRKTLQEQNIDYEIMQLGKQPIRDCINCNRCHGEGCIFDDDMVNEFIQKKQKMLTDLCLELPSITQSKRADYYLFCIEHFIAVLLLAYIKLLGSKPAAAIASARFGKEQLLPLMSSINIFHCYDAYCFFHLLEHGTWSYPPEDNAR